MSERSRIVYANFAPQLESMSEEERLGCYKKLDKQATNLKERLSYVRYTMALRGELEDVYLKAAMLEGIWLRELGRRTIELESRQVSGFVESSNSAH